MIELNSKDRSKEKHFRPYQIEQSLSGDTSFQIIDHNDKKWMWNYLNNEREVNEVCAYLKKYNLKIKTERHSKGNYTYDVILEGMNLSGNGCHFSRENLLFHVRYHREYEAIKESNAFKLYRKLKEKYMDVERYFDIYYNHGR